MTLGMNRWIGGAALVLLALPLASEARKPDRSKPRSSSVDLRRSGPAQRQAEDARRDPDHVFDGRRAKPPVVDGRNVKPWGRGEREREWRKPRAQPPRRQAPRREPPAPRRR
jgi:hypothetical protein